MKPLAFKVRTQGTYNGAKGGKVKAGFGGAGALWYEDKTFTIAAVQDQWLLAPTLSLSLSLSHPKPPMTQQPIPAVSLRFLSVCSGMEAASVAWEPLGWKAVGFSEIEPFPCAILKHRFPNTPNYGSLTEYTQWPLQPGSVDLLVGGTPCQSFSVAGLRKGMADPRGNLALVFLGLADRVKPRWIVWENVPGVLSSDGGRDFGSFLGALEQLGYGWAYRILDAQHFGVPQRRRRVFVVACLGAGGWESAASVLFEPESLCGDTAKGRKKGQGVASDAQGGAGSGGGCWWDGGQVSQTLDAVLQKGQTMPEKNRFPAVLQPIVIDRAAFNQGENAQFDPHIGPADVMDPLVARGPHADGVRDAGVIPIHDQATRFAGKRGDNQDGKGNGLGIGQPGDPMNTLTRGDHHAVAIPLDAAGVPFRKSKRAQSATDSESWVEAGEANTLNNFDLGDTRTTHAVVSNIAPTIGASGPPYSRTGNERVEAEALAITFQPGNLRREAGAEPSTTTTTTLKASAGDQMPHVAIVQASELRLSGKITEQTTSPTLLAQTKSGDNDPLAVHPVVPLDGMNLLSRLGECGETHSMQNFDPNDPQFTLRKGGSQHGVLTPMAVRRLTPTECERLQGFPDGWSCIPWKGKPSDQCPDGPRYKACGNSMAVPVMRWIGTRIAQVEAASTRQ
jgi:DNA (cytosine-5)-methyltransferase 1